MGTTAREWEDELDWLENQQSGGLRCLVCDVALMSLWALLAAACLGMFAASCSVFVDRCA